jgi:hypothetical protein
VTSPLRRVTPPPADPGLAPRPCPLPESACAAAGATAPTCDDARGPSLDDVSPDGAGACAGTSSSRSSAHAPQGAACTACDNRYSGVDDRIPGPASEQGAESHSRFHLLVPSTPPPAIGGDWYVLAPYPAAGWFPTTPPLKGRCGRGPAGRVSRLASAGNHRFCEVTARRRAPRGNTVSNRVIVRARRG